VQEATDELARVFAQWVKEDTTAFTA